MATEKYIQRNHRITPEQAERFDALYEQLRSLRIPKEALARIVFELGLQAIESAPSTLHALAHAGKSGRAVYVEEKK